MLVEIDLLDYLAYQMGCGVLSDLRLSQQSERLHRLTAAIPFTGGKEPSGEIACKNQTLPPRGGSTYHMNRVPVHNEPTRSAHSKDFI